MKSRRKQTFKICGTYYFTHKWQAVTPHPRLVHGNENPTRFSWDLSKFWPSTKFPLGRWIGWISNLVNDKSLCGFFSHYEIQRNGKTCNWTVMDVVKLITIPTFLKKGSVAQYLRGRKRILSSIENIRSRYDVVKWP